MKLNETMVIDLDGVYSIDTQSFPSRTQYTKSIVSTIGNDEYIFHFINGYCYEPQISLEFDNTHFNHYSQYLDVYYPLNSLLKRCKGTINNDTCSNKTNNKCLRCNTPSYYTINKTINLKNIDTTKISNHSISKESSVDNSNDIYYELNIIIMNGICYDPLLTFKYAQIDNNGNIDTELLEIYQSNFNKGNKITDCGYDAKCCLCTSFSTCIDNYYLDYYSRAPMSIIDIIKQSSFNYLAVCNMLSMNIKALIQCAAEPILKINETNVIHLDGVLFI